MMIYPLTQEVTSQDYSIQDFPSGSSTDDEEINEILDNVLHKIKQLSLFRYVPSYLFWGTLSSSTESSWFSVVEPNFEMQDVGSIAENKEIYGKKKVSEATKHDFVVQIPPIREFTLQVRLKSIEKAVPHIVEPEEE